MNPVHKWNNERGGGIFPPPNRSCTVLWMQNSIRRLLLTLLLALPLAGVGALATASEPTREPVTPREPTSRSDSRSGSDRSGSRDFDSSQSRGSNRDGDRVRSGSNSGRSGEDSSGKSGDNSGRSGSDDKENKGSDKRSSSDDRRGGTRSNQARTTIDVERNARGGDRQRAEVLLIGPSGVADSVRGAGYQILSERNLDSLQQSLLRVQVREGETVEQAVDRLRQQVPGVRTAPNHIFQPMGIQPATATIPANSVNRAMRDEGLVGVIDTGADTSLDVLRGMVLGTRAFAPGGYVPRAHGSAVAQLAGASGARVMVADVFGEDTHKHLVAPADAIAAAIDWLLASKLRVINISIEGPRNEVLDFVVAEALARGVVIVAAMGNGGPAAAPGYPAACPGVVAVTALDETGLIYRRASRGQHVQFSARGSYPGNAAPVFSSEPLSGTSFAAPIVAAEIERHWRNAPQATREQILATMHKEALDLGDPGWDPVYGWGRIDPPRAPARLQP